MEMKRDLKIFPKWYALHSYSGREKATVRRLKQRIQITKMEDKIFEIFVPEEEIIEFESGERKVKKGKVLPGYILIKMIMDPNSWRVVKKTSGVINFLGRKNPKSLPLREVQEIQKRVKVESLKDYSHFKIGDLVQVKSGIFIDLNGIIKEINIKQGKLKISTLIFDRQTLVELYFDQVEKI